MVLTKYILPLLAAAGAAFAQCDGPITIQNQGDATALSSCTTVEGDVTIGSPTSGTLALDGVQQITGDLTCVNATQLTSLSGDSLVTIGGKFHLEELQILSTLEFPSLEEVDTIQWVALPALQSLAFSSGVSSVTNMLVSNTGMTSLEGFELDTIAVMDINNNLYLDTVDVNNMRNATDYMSFAANSRRLEVRLPNLEFAANMTFRNVSNVDLRSLAYVNGSIGFYSNSFESIDLPNLTATGQALVFENGIGLSNISARQLGEVGAAFNIKDNFDLKIIDGFPELAVVVGALDFSGDFDVIELPALEDVRGGINLQTRSTNFSCEEFDDLRDRDILKGVYTCRSNEENPGSLGTNVGSSGNSTRPNAAPRIFKSAVPTYSFCGLIVFMLFL